MARNKFKAALNHIKSTDVDEKIQRLNESPTNNTSGVYDLSPRGQRYGEKNPEKTFYANLDGSWPPGVPGTPGERKYVRPIGYWEEGPGATPSVQHDEIVELDFSYDTQTDNPRQTTTLIDETTGRVKTELPPNSRSFILGPLVDMYFHNHRYDNRTYIGYIQKDTREFVLLGYIQGTWGNDNNGDPIRADGYESGFNSRVWNGQEGTFVASNPNFTFEMLQWHHERLKEGKYVKNVAYFNSGGIPVSQGAGGTGQPSGTYQGNVSGTPTGGDAGNNGDADQTHGSGGNPDIGTPQSEPVSGNQNDAGFPWDLLNKAMEAGEDAFNALMNMTPGQKAELAMTALNIGLDIAAVAGILFPEPGTTAAGLARMATRLGFKAGSAAMKGARAARGAAGLANKLGGKGLARGLRGAQVGATGVKKGGYQALKGGQNLHRGSKGLLSPGGKGVYSAPSVGKVGPGGFRPGSGAGRYVKSGSNPLGGAQGRSGQAGGVLGSITPGGARRIGGIEPQAVVNPRTFQKGQQLFQKVQGGAYPKSPRANQFRQQAQKAGFKQGQADIPASQVPKSKSTGNPFADKYRLPANYKDKLGKAQAYFQNNLNGVGYRTLGFTEVERMDALMNKAFKKQGFTDQQIDTIKRENLLVTKYGESPSLKAKEAAAKREAEEAAKEREKQQQLNLGTRRTVLNTFKNIQSSSGRSEVRSGTNKPYMNIRVGDTTSSSSNTNNFGKDFGQLASARGPYGTPGADKPFVRRGYKDKDGKFVDFDNPATWPKIPKARQPRKTPLIAQHELQGDILSEVATPVSTVETPPVTQGARESAQQTADATADMIAQQYPKEQVAEFALDAESAALDPSTFDYAGGVTLDQIASLISATAKRKEEEERKKRNVTASFKQSGQLISEDRKKLLREIKQPLNEVGELQPQKLKNYRPNFKGRYVPQNTPDVTASKEANDMVRAKNAAGQTWRESDKYWGGYESQERANVIYDHVGHGQLYWDEIVSHNQGKKTSRDREIQEELNKQYSLIAEKEMSSIAEQETLDAPKDPLFKKVRNKLKDKIDYQDKPSKLGYPNTPPKEQEQGYHPDYGKRKDYYKKLDPHSADAMPETGDFDTDDTVEKQKSLYGLYLKQQRMQGKPNS